MAEEVAGGRSDAVQVGLVVDSHGHVVREEEDPVFAPDEAHEKRLREEADEARQRIQETERILDAMEAAGIDLPPPPQVINVDIDGEWMAHVSHIDAVIDEVTANQGGEVTDEQDIWQNELDDFVDDLGIRPTKSHDPKRSANFDIVSDDDVIMPLLLTAHPYLRSKAMRHAILEAFAQGFRYGSSWEQMRADADDDRLSKPVGGN